MAKWNRECLLYRYIFSIGQYKDTHKPSSHLAKHTLHHTAKRTHALYADHTPFFAVCLFQKYSGRDAHNKRCRCCEWKTRNVCRAFLLKCERPPPPPSIYARSTSSSPSSSCPCPPLISHAYSSTHRQTHMLRDTRVNGFIHTHIHTHLGSSNAASFFGCCWYIPDGVYLVCQ